MEITVCIILSICRFLNSIQQNKQRYLDKTKLEEDSEIERFRNISKSIKTLPDVVSASVPSSEYPSSSSHTSVSQTTIAATTKSSNPAAFQPPIIKGTILVRCLMLY